MRSPAIIRKLNSSGRSRRDDPDDGDENKTNENPGTDGGGGGNGAHGRMLHQPQGHADEFEERHKQNGIDVLEDCRYGKPSGQPNRPDSSGYSNSMQGMPMEQQEKMQVGAETIRNRLIDSGVIWRRDDLLTLSVEALNNQIDLHRQAERDASFKDFTIPAKGKLLRKLYKLSALHASLTKLERSTVINGEPGPVRVREYMPGSVLARKNDVHEDEEGINGKY